jgi:hypothetical protein
VSCPPGGSAVFYLEAGKPWGHLRRISLLPGGAQAKSSKLLSRRGDLSHPLAIGSAICRTGGYNEHRFPPNDRSSKKNFEIILVGTVRNLRDAMREPVLVMMPPSSSYHWAAAPSQEEETRLATNSVRHNPGGGTLAQIVEFRRFLGTHPARPFLDQMRTSIARRFRPKYPASEYDFISFVGVVFAHRWVDDGSRCLSHSCSSYRLIGSLAFNNCVAIVDLAR